MIDIETKEDQMRLHIGCGKRIIPGFINVDALPYPHVDHVCPAEKLDFCEDDSVDLVYACHILEHYARREFGDALREWRRVLKPGGILRLAVPNFAACAKIYYERGLEDGLSGLIGMICGGQSDEYDIHKMIFDEPFLKTSLMAIGFSKVRRWDWRKTSHSEYDDFSQAYIPHLDKENGTHMSLNLEAIK